MHGLPEVPESIRSLGGINLADSTQRNMLLYPLLEKNMLVVDFWLSRAVFPTETKQFPHKIVASSWDLCKASPACGVVSGFSGTNDSRLLLPLGIQQRDLPELQGANGKAVADLLSATNGYHALAPGTTGESLVQLLASLCNSEG